MSLILYIGVPLLTCLALLWRLSGRRIPRGLKAAPGPRGHLIVGNTFQISEHPNRDYIRWAKQFGEVYKIRLGWNDWYMLNSPDAVKEIMDRQSAVTSSRAPAPVASDALSGGMRFLLMPYGTPWRKLRAVSHKLLTPKMSDTFQPSQEFEAKQLLMDILDDNKNNTEFYMHIRRYTVSVIMTSVYGRRIPTWECEEVKEIYGLMKDFSEVAAPGKFLADTIPPLGRLPKWMQWWRNTVLPYQNRQAKIWMQFWTSLQDKMARKEAPECFAKRFIESDYQKMDISELQAAFLAGSMIEAGSETTSSALNSCILYLTAHPEVAARAHEELDKVVGHQRSPSFEDEASLPYVRAIVKEVLRVRPVTNMGTPHYTTSDVTYKDIFIPKGSIVAIQQYPIHYNPDYYPEPDSFKPERYLDYPLRAGAYAAGADPTKRDHFSFGAGRRICSGLHLAENSLFITVAKLLWAFDIRPALDHRGNQPPVDLSDDAYEPGANTLPKPFKARFLPRSAEIKQLILSEWQEAKKNGFVLRDIKVNVDGMVV